MHRRHVSILPLLQRVVHLVRVPNDRPAPAVSARGTRASPPSLVTAFTSGGVRAVNRLPESLKVYPGIVSPRSARGPVHSPGFGVRDGLEHHGRLTFRVEIDRRHRHDVLVVDVRDEPRFVGNAGFLAVARLVVPRGAAGSLRGRSLRRRRRGDLNPGHARRRPRTGTHVPAVTANVEGAGPWVFFSRHVPVFNLAFIILDHLAVGRRVVVVVLGTPVGTPRSRTPHH